VPFYREGTTLLRDEIFVADARLPTHHNARQEPAKLTISPCDGGFQMQIERTWLDKTGWLTDSWAVGSVYPTREDARAAFEGAGAIWRRVDDDEMVMRVAPRKIPSRPFARAVVQRGEG